MAFEVYEYRIFTKYRTRKQSVRFHWAIDNASGGNPFEIARQITKNLNVDTLFLTLYAQLISAEAGITDTICRRVIPLGGPSSRVHIGGGGLQGLWLGRIAENFVGAQVRLIRLDGSPGKNTIRPGPIGNGAITNSAYYGVFVVAMNTFLSEALSPRVTVAGDSFHLTLMDKHGFTFPASDAFLVWPPARQINRRWGP